MWRLQIPWWQFAVRGAVVYVALAVLLRVTGKRQLGQIGLIDLVLILLVANAVQNAMVGPDTSLTGGLIAMTVLVVLDWAIDRLGLRSPLFHRVFAGSPTLLAYDGRYLDENLRREGYRREEIDSQIREHGYESIEQIHSVTVEPDGAISVVPVENTVVLRGRRRVRQLRKQ